MYYKLENLIYYVISSTYKGYLGQTKRLILCVRVHKLQKIFTPGTPCREHLLIAKETILELKLYILILCISKVLSLYFNSND